MEIGSNRLFAGIQHGAGTILEIIKVTVTTGFADIDELSSVNI